ncbi:MAG: hypothetical protein ABRQ25_02810 [Clostridiaceae bacterium]
MKKITVLLLSFVLIFSLAGCTKSSSPTTDSNNDNSTASEDTSTVDNNEQKDFQYSDEYISAHLGNEYAVTYKFAYFENNKETNTAVVTIKKNEKGYYFNMGDASENIGDSEFMYVKENDKYVMCTKGGSGVFSKVSEVTMTEDEIKATAAGTLSYMSFYKTYVDDLNKVGTETICGRTCDKYSMKSYNTAASVYIEFCIDQKTGICLKYTVNAKDWNERGGFNFECTEFKTDNVELPAVQ